MGIRSGIPRDLRRAFALNLCAAVLLMCTSCGSTASAATDTQRMQELGNLFVEQLDTEIIPLRERAEKLVQLDAVTVTGDKTYGISLLYTFYEDYRVGQNAELTIIFDTKSFVVNKIVFEGAKGYYFRYEYDQFDKSAINVTSQPLDRLQISEDSQLGKVELTLQREKMADIIVSLRNIVEE